MRVKNRKVIMNISRNTLRENGKKYVIAILAIVLTSTLFTTLFTVGGSMLSTIQTATMRQVGTKAHAGFKFLTQEQYDLVAADPAVKDISYDIIVGVGENPELAKTYTEIRYTEEKNAEWGFCMPTTGTLPVEKYDLATSTNVLDALGVSHKLGETVTLIFTANGVIYEQDFTLCGFYEGDIAFGANEAYVSREYCDEVAPVITVPLYERWEEDDTSVNSYAGSINADFWFSSSLNIESQMKQLKERLGFDARVNDGINWAYATSSMDVGTVLLVIIVLVVILASCYLIIYNVFSISVARDIRFYGLLKTVGTTGKQLKKIVHGIALWLSVIGIPVGLILGYLIGRAFMPAIISTTMILVEYEMNSSPVIFAAGALFTLATVFLSCIRPCRMAASVSPVEAVRWTGIVPDGGGKRKRSVEKKAGRFVRKPSENVSAGMNFMPAEASKENVSVGDSHGDMSTGKSYGDAAVLQNRQNAVCGKDRQSANNGKSRAAAQRTTRPVTPLSMALAGIRRDKHKMTTVILSITLSLVLLNGTCALIRGFDMETYLKKFIVTDFFITDNGILNSWGRERTLNGISEEIFEEIRGLPGLERAGGVWCSTTYHKFMGIVYDRALAILEKNRAELPSPYADSDIEALEKRAEMYCFIYGVDECLWGTLELEEGQKFDAEKFATGEYVLSTGFYLEGKDSYYLPDEEVTITFENGKSKTYKVLAVGNVPYALGPRFTSYLSVQFVLPAAEYAAQMGETGALGVAFDIEDAYIADVETWCSAYTENVRPELAYDSRAAEEKDFADFVRIYALIGGVLSGILALIGILNFTNAVLMSIDARKRELAVLQSVGMTGGQVKRMLTGEGLLYAAGALLLTLTAGNLLTYVIVWLLSQDMWYFTWKFSVLPVLLCAPFLVVISIVIPAAGYRSMVRQTVVERLRETE